MPSTKAWNLLLLCLSTLFKTAESTANGLQNPVNDPATSVKSNADATAQALIGPAVDIIDILTDTIAQTSYEKVESSTVTDVFVCPIIKDVNLVVAKSLALSKSAKPSVSKWSTTLKQYFQKTFISGSNLENQMSSNVADCRHLSQFHNILLNLSGISKVSPSRLLKLQKLATAAAAKARFGSEKENSHGTTKTVDVLISGSIRVLNVLIQSTSDDIQLKSVDTTIITSYICPLAEDIALATVNIERLIKTTSDVLSNQTSNTRRQFEELLASGKRFDNLSSSAHLKCRNGEQFKLQTALHNLELRVAMNSTGSLTSSVPNSATDLSASVAASTDFETASTGSAPSTSKGDSKKEESTKNPNTASSFDKGIAFTLMIGSLILFSTISILF